MNIHIYDDDRTRWAIQKVEYRGLESNSTTSNLLDNQLVEMLKKFPDGTVFMTDCKNKDREKYLESLLLANSLPFTRY